MQHSKQHRQSYGQVSSESRLIALTGLNQAAFTALCTAFEEHWQTYISEYRLNGVKRQRRLSKKETDVLPRIEDKVFFLLKYLKTHPLQEELAHDFAMSQPQANMWIHALLPVLQATLRAMKCAPARTSEGLSEVLEQYEYILADGSERPIQRPNDIEEQNASYSGKKKACTAKNVILCAPTKQILFATTTTEGSAHDKAIADDAALDLSSNVVILADSGFQGFAAGKATVLLPCKKPPGKDHPEHHRLWNRLFARVRVKVEHALANIKTFRIVKETIRLKTAQSRDCVFELACGLANLRLLHPHTKL